LRNEEDFNSNNPIFIIGFEWEATPT
jgi:hypothetical protein